MGVEDPEAASISIDTSKRETVLNWHVKGVPGSWLFPRWVMPLAQTLERAKRRYGCYSCLASTSKRLMAWSNSCSILGL
jgi:hypothetical protein